MKSQAQQFAWMFIIIAGAIIIAFFVMITVRYMSLQELKENAEVSLSLYNQLYGLKKISTQAALPINLLFPRKISFSCGSFQVGNFLSLSLSKQIVFAPSKIEANKLLVWMVPWKYPFFVDNVFLISSPKESYTVVYDTSSAEFVRKIPNLFNLAKTQGTPSTIAGKTISLASYSADVNIDLANQEVEISGSKYPLFGDALAYGAMFADDYECMVDICLTKLLDIAKIYEQKASYMQIYYRNCNYGPIKQKIQSFIKAIEDKDYSKIKQYSKEIDTLNNQFSGECPPVY